MSHHTQTFATKVPFLDLARIHDDLRDVILADIGELFSTNAFSNGPDVGRFEKAYARYCERSICVGVASGLDALRLGLQALDVGRGDEVIVPAQTFVATWEAVSQVGATPVPVDIDESDWNIGVAAVEDAISPRTRCVIPVDLFGQLADMSALRTVADRKDLVIVEDACQAHGARREGNAPGTHAELTAYSFYPGKNLGASGDAGAVVTDDDKLASRVRLLREHGQGRKYAHEAVGWTSRLDTIQAVVLARKLPHLDEWNEERRAVAARYLEELAGIDGLRLPPVASASEPVWHLFVVGVEHPEELAAELAERGIATGRHYPQPPHLSGAYESLGFSEGSFPVAERVAREGLSLPIFPGMTDDEVSAVVAAVRAYFHV